jgi:site-specific DNA recombinase
MNIAIYCRVSSAKQEDGYSLDDQERGCRMYAAQRGYQVVAVEKEVADSTALSRPRLDALREAGRRGEFERVIVYVQDRLGRGADIIAVTLYLLQASGLTPECVLEPFGDTALDKGLVAIRGMVSGMEKEAIARRTQAGRRARARSGKLIPGAKPLYGYRWRGADKGAYEIDPDTAPVVQRIFRELAGGASLGAIAAGLTDDGIPTSTGTPAWNRTTILRIVNNPRYAGDAVAFGPRKTVCVTAPGGDKVWREIPRPEEEMIALPAGVVPPIVTRAEADAVAGLLARNKAEQIRNHRNPDAFLLRGYIYCGACGGTVNSAMQPSNGEGCPDRAVYLVPRTRWRHRGCPYAKVPAYKIDAEVWESLRARLGDRGFIAQQIARHRQKDTAGEELVAVEQSIADVSRRQVNLARTIGNLDDADASAPLEVELASLSTQKRSLEARRTALRAQRAAWEETGRILTQLEEWCDVWRDNLDNADFALKRKILHALDVRVSLFPAARKPRWEIATDWSVALGDHEPAGDIIALHTSRSGSASRRGRRGAGDTPSRTPRSRSSRRHG